MRRALLLLLLLATLGAGAWWYFDQRGSSSGELISAPDTTQESSTAAAAPAARRGVPSIRALVGIVKSGDEKLSRAHILSQGRIDIYALGDKVPADDAELVVIEHRYVDLEKDGKRERLTLQDLTDEEKFLYSPGVNLDDVEDVVGDLTVPETPEGKRALEIWGDPYQECDRMKDDAQADACRTKKDEEMNAAAEACDVYDTADEHEACLYKAYGVKGSPAEIKQYMDEQQKKREARRAEKGEPAPDEQQRRERRRTEDR